MNTENFFTKKAVVAVLALSACLLWGSAYPAVKIGYNLFHIMPDDVASILIFAGYRFALAGFILLVFSFFIGKQIFAFTKKDVINILIVSLVMTVMQYICFYIGLAHATGSNSAIVNSTSVFFSAIAAHIFYKNDHINRLTLAGCIIGFAGVIAVNFNPGTFKLSFNFLGEGMVIMSAFFMALGSIFSKRMSQTFDPAVMTGWYLGIGGVTLTIIGYSFGGSLTGFSVASTTLLIYMAFLSAVAFTLLSVLLKYNPISKVAVFHFSTPVFGVLLSAFFLGDNVLQMKNLIALVLVCVGIMLVNGIWKPKRVLFDKLNN